MKLHELVKEQQEMVKQRQAEELDKLIQYYGTQSKLSRALGVSRFVVNRWVDRGRISATSAIDAERVTGGRFKKEELRPDVIDWIKG